MTSTIGGDDIDLPDDRKDELEAALRRDARELFRKGKKKDRDKKLARAKEISRRKSKRAHQN